MALLVLLTPNNQSSYSMEKKLRERTPTHPPTSSTTTTRAPPRLACPILFVLHRVEEGVWDAQVFYLYSGGFKISSVSSS